MAIIIYEFLVTNTLNLGVQNKDIVLADDSGRYRQDMAIEKSVWMDKTSNTCQTDTSTSEWPQLLGILALAADDIVVAFISAGFATRSTRQRANEQSVRCA
ncbi:unnamed protein product [Fusarium graminearum]|uniref:Chromosome 3, complete genome n=1 Tax=Gibberella zeae (strain ATCC MYA-4620 / CBS 123657 / FGSC 9075 / NRRL 31084 / PH-1) TaxID=229533 RepID=I1RNF8_GIBZE|nr:hypothetical protein FGSG_05534 [Fusarium graminearum PH-1]ESU11506.1 hypothetical protein FGSG_05534 [Fusarium graminearum PH-1]CEF88352.1 unnamed protein product [Fusarium graminearum]CZS84178.1 unnamed protein product [Fusarium graminearum]|eukprot:XP_011324082.1 hypothetical protein FGSG_05534 [Fusarium graminearum PH-1]